VDKLISKYGQKYQNYKGDALQMRLVDGDLKSEMEKAMKDIHQINKELNDINKKKKKNQTAP